MNDAGFFLVVLLFGGGGASLAIWGIIKLARKFSAAGRRGDTGTQFLMVLGIAALSVLVLAGVASLGCVAMMSNTHF
jgi:hypothetical protein